MSVKLIISVKEARKLLGKKYEKMTDEEVESLIIQLDEIAKLSLEVARNKALQANAH